MSKANIKIQTETLDLLKEITGIPTGQKAVEFAISELLAKKTRTNIVGLISKVKFKPSFDPLKLRKNER